MFVPSNYESNRMCNVMNSQSPIYTASASVRKEGGHFQPPEARLSRMGNSQIQCFANENRVRNKYLLSLGITATQQPKKIIPRNLNHQPMRVPTRPRRTVKTKEMLKGSEDLTCGSPQGVSTPQDSHQGGSSRKGRSVSFDDSVSIRLIPSLSHLSMDIRKQIWSSKEEMRFNVQRNAAEFAFEGWNWQQVVEDHDMILGRHGELIHPAHMLHIRALTVQQKFLAMRAAAVSSKRNQFVNSHNELQSVVHP